MCDHASGGPRVGNHESWNDRSDRSHASIVCDHPAQPGLHVEPPEELLHVTNRALDLHDQQRAQPKVIGNQVDTAAVAEMIEADLGAGYPSEGGEQMCRPFLERSVGAIQQSVELLASPSDLQVDGGLQSFRQTINCADRQRTQVAALHS